MFFYQDGTSHRFQDMATISLHHLIEPLSSIGSLHMLCQNISSGNINLTTMKITHYAACMRTNYILAKLIGNNPKQWTLKNNVLFCFNMVLTICFNMVLKVCLVIAARLTMAVAIKNCYPTQPPVFTLQAAYGNNTTQAANNDSIRVRQSVMLNNQRLPRCLPAS